MDSLLEIGFKNFKIFKDLSMFEIAPITLITGKNNSGKSSLLKGIRFLVENTSPGELENLDLSKFKEVLGDYKDIKNYYSDSNEISFILGVHAETLLSEFPDFVKSDIGKTFTLSVFHYYVERTYLAKNKKAILKNINFYSDNKLKNILFSIKIISKGIVLLDFNYTEFLKLSHSKTKGETILSSNLKLPDGLDIESKETFRAYIDDLISNLLFKNVEINISEVNSDSQYFYYNAKLYYSYQRRGNDSSDNFKFSLSIKEVKSRNKKFTISDFLNIYWIATIDLLLNDKTIGEIGLLSGHNISEQAYILNPSRIIDRSIAEDLYNHRMVYRKISDLEEFPTYLAFTSYMDVIRTSSKVGNKIYGSEQSFQRILMSCMEKNFTPDSDQNKFLIDCLQEFEIGDTYEILKNEKGIFEFIVISNKGRRENLENMGFGSRQIVPLLLQIALLTVEEVRDRYPILISEPEANLHPNLQSKFAILLMAAYKVFPLSFIIETHSEYLIRKLQCLVSEKAINQEDLIIYYLAHQNNESSLNVKKIKIQNDGQLSEEFGPGFIDEALNLKLELLKLKNAKKI